MEYGVLVHVLNLSPGRVCACVCVPLQVVGDFFPALYMRHGAVAHPALMCTRMRQLLAAHTPDVMAVCRGPAAAADSTHFKTMSSTAVLMQLSAAATVGNSTNPTDKEIQIYQICLWTGAALVAVLALAVYSLAYMNNRKDTMLYSKFNPNWYGWRERERESVCVCVCVCNIDDEAHV
jgi:hypothetical protein